jgi:uncharacterized lipoprotein NlpE involved in copper resistance
MKSISFIVILSAAILIFATCKTKESEPLPTIDDANLDTQIEYTEDKVNDATLNISESNTENEVSYQDEFKGKSMLGHFIYMADAAVFTPCGASKAIPVQMGTEVYMALEEAYLNTVDGGTPCFVEIMGKIEKLPSYDGGKKVDMIVVEKLIELQFYRDCP